MNAEQYELIRDYRLLRDEVDGMARRLERLHCRQMACKRGCSDCCMNLSVWPVEYYSILDELRHDTTGTKPVFRTAAACGFLCDDQCIIYPYRPIICRTHGLPLVYWHDETEPPGYGVMFCGKNFADADTLEFGPDNTLNMDEINHRLARLNVEFLSQLTDSILAPDSRIELKQLVNDL
jgi:Fe-S-cluster containining protein